MAKEKIPLEFTARELIELAEAVFIYEARIASQDEDMWDGQSQCVEALRQRLDGIAGMPIRGYH